MCHFSINLILMCFIHRLKQSHMRDTLLVLANSASASRENVQALKHETAHLLSALQNELKTSSQSIVDACRRDTSGKLNHFNETILPA